MKKTSLRASVPLVIALLLAAPLAGMSQITTVFQDNFTGGSTLNPATTAAATPTSSKTAYSIGSSKNATGTAISGNALNLATASTTSGYTEATALFTTSPITLNTAGQYVEVYYTFTDNPNIMNGSLVNLNEQLSIGMYNSGGSAPTNSTLLWNAGLLGAAITQTNGACKSWVGYTGQFAYTTNGASSLQSSALATRPAQSSGTSNLVQACGYSSGYPGGANLVTMAGVSGQPTLTNGSQYTLSMRIYYVNATTLAITNTLYVGAGNNGAVFTAGGWTGRYGTTVSSPLTMTFDALELGIRPTHTTGTATTNKINNVTVLLVTPIAPNISNLTNQTVVAGTSPILSPTVTGVPTPGYQWFVSTDGGTTSNALAYATGASLTLTNVQYSQNNYIYTLEATNSLGTNDANMTLSVIVTPSITGLNDQAVNVGDTVTINPTVGGIPTPTFQWRTNGVNLADGLDANGSTIAGSSTSTLYITNAQTADSLTYSLVASNAAGIVTNSMHLTVASGSQLPVLTGPTNLTVIQGSNATFSASATGLPVPTLQWLDQTGIPITDATNSTLVLSNVQYSQNGYTYSCVASNSVGSVTNSATLTVLVPPGITTQPTNVAVLNGQPASFTVVASGVPAPNYQWYKNGIAIPIATNSTATNATLSFAAVTAADMANYYVQVTNSVGATNSVTVSLTVNSAMSIASLSPTNSASGLCYDTPLTVTFSSAPLLGSTGAIKIFAVTNASTPVDTIYATNGLVQQRTFPGDGQSFSYKTIVISGSSVTIYPHFNVMSSNQTYYVTVDAGAFTDSTGALFTGVTATNVWQFSTKTGGPVDPLNPVVDSNGSADFLTVQGAVNSISSGNTTPRVINIHNGTYTEIVDIAGKHNVTFRGQSRTGTFVGYPNNATLQSANNGTTHARMAFKVNANDIALDNLTITNMTPQGGSQAEALMTESGAKRCVVNNCDIDSRQDTILANGSSQSQIYFYKSTIKGNFDYIWGGGNLYFDQCKIQTIGGTGSGQLTAARTDTSATTSTNFPWQNPFGTYTANGVSFVGCAFTADSGVSNNITLAGSNGTSNNLVSWFGCDFATNCVAPSASLFNGNYLFWQNSNTMTNSPVTFAVLTTIGVTNNDPRLMAATNPVIWFYGWTPSLAPNILTNPASQLGVPYNTNVTFTVAATGIPDPTYQWLYNGSPIPGATSATLTLPNVTPATNGSYSVVVTTTGGSATSGAASLTVTPPANTAPVFNASITSTNINVGVSLAVACTATDSDTPAQTLTYSLLTGPSGAAVNASTGNFTWRPTTAQAGSANPVSVVVTDNGTPAMSATNNFTVTVNALTSPTAGSPSYFGGQFSVTVSGQVGPDYYLQANTNLIGGTWTTVASTNSPATMPVSLTDPNAGSQAIQFYRIVTGPPAP